MAILTTSDFLKIPYKIPAVESETRLPDFIEAAEEGALLSILGVKLYDDFKEGIEEAEPEEKWIKLRDGGDYTAWGTLYRYKGLRDLLIPYVYAMWLRETYDRHVMEGIIINSNATIQGVPATESISPATRIARAFNVYSAKVGDIDRQESTLYGFMYQNRSDYEGWVFDPPGTMNVWNI